MSIPREHHIVPKMILRRFTDEEGSLYVFDLNRPRAKAAKTPKKAFVVRDLNTVTNADGEIDVGLELFYSALESKVAPIIEKIVSSAERRKLPGLSPEERNVWDNFVYHQQKRSPDIYARLGLLANVEANFAGYIAKFEREHRPLTDEERAQVSDPHALPRIIQGAIVGARGKGSQDVLKVLAERGIVIALINPANKSFIVGDHPQARMGEKSNLEETELWMPVSSRVAVSPGGPPISESFLNLDGDQVRRLNVTIAANCSMIAGRSEALISSLSKYVGSNLPPIVRAIA